MKVTDISVLLAVLFVSLSDATDCPNNWLAHSGSCYFFSRDIFDWPDALVICKAMNAHLAEIEDADEDNFVRHNIKGTQAWIGLTDIEEEGKYMWMTSHSEATYTHWAIAQPNHISSKANCVVMRSSSYGRGWDDDTCTTSHSYVCEKNPEETEIVG